MDRKRFDELTAYMAAVWGRELSNLQRAGGWKLLHSLSDSAVENAVVEIADSGLDHMPTWPLVLKTARAVAERERDQLPALPAGDSLSDSEHRGALITLRARQSYEQLRRADRMSNETKQLAMITRMKLSVELLLPPWSTVDPGAWDRVFEQKLSELQQQQASA